jgi:hypothetical protein
MPIPDTQPTYADLERDLDAATREMIAANRKLPAMFAHDDLVALAHRLYWAETEADAARVGVTYDADGRVHHSV